MTKHVYVVLLYHLPHILLSPLYHIMKMPTEDHLTNSDRMFRKSVEYHELDKILSYPLFQLQESCTVEPVEFGHERYGYYRFTCDTDVTSLFGKIKEVVWFQEEKALNRGSRIIKKNKQENAMQGNYKLPEYNDPLYKNEWYLSDLNVSAAWNMNITGHGVTIALVDDGVDVEHPDLMDSFSPLTSWDFVSSKPVSAPTSLEDRHGTRCAGQMFSKPNNSICGVGVAFDAKMSVIRLISAFTYDSTEASALTFKFHQNHIYSSSWGPSDDGKSVDGPNELTRLALLDGILYGRNGLGSIYVMASGNGGVYGDICTLDGYANSIYTISIGSIQENYQYPSYAEVCAAQLAVTFGGNQSVAIASTDFIPTDLRNGDVNQRCTKDHFGTSSSTPFAAGLIALILENEPTLTWRDIQHIIVNSAVPVNLDDKGWHQNGAGRLVHHYYGFGMLQADKMLKETFSYRFIPERIQIVLSQSSKLPIVILPNQELSFEISCCNNTSSKWIDPKTNKLLTLDYPSIALVEHVQLSVDIEHQYRRELTIKLISPSGTESILMKPRIHDRSDEGLLGWTFMTVLNWGEDSQGVWKVVIHDNSNIGGTLLNWKLSINGIPCSTDKWKLNQETDRYSCEWEAINQSLLNYNMYIMGALLTTSCLVVVLAIYYIYYKVKRRRDEVKGSYKRVGQKLPRAHSLESNMSELLKSSTIAVENQETALPTRREAELVVVSDPDAIEMDVIGSSANSPSLRRNQSPVNKQKDRLRPNVSISRLQDIDFGQLPSPVVKNPLASPSPRVFNPDLLKDSQRGPKRN